MEEIAEMLQRILKKAHMTSKSLTKKNDVCPICQDTTWVETENGFKRCKCYKKKLLERLWKGFGVDPNKVKKLNSYEAYNDLPATQEAKEKAINYIKNFKDIRLTENNSFGLFGQPGAGKSHIVIAIGAALLNQNIQVVYMSYLEVLRELEANRFDNEYYLKISDRYKRPKVLIIDDLFKDKVRNGELAKDKYGNRASLTESDIKHIMPILNCRYQNSLPTIFSTECTPSLLVELDEALEGRIMESCQDNYTVFKGKEYNYRMRKFMKKED
jgi:DNA replication protein DnaC